jgi:hypothetical protein
LNFDYIDFILLLHRIYMASTLCGGLTNSGNGCRRRVKIPGDMCSSHNIETISKKCSGRNKNGRPCARTVFGANNMCHSHINQVIQKLPFKRSSLKRGSQETLRRRMSLISALRPRTHKKNACAGEMPKNHGHADQTAAARNTCARHAKPQFADYLPENISHRSEMVNCGICLDEKKKKGLRLSCCNFKQNICIECTHDMLADNYQKNIDGNLDIEADANYMCKIASAHCKCPFCRKKKSFKKFMGMIKKNIRNKKKIN